MSRVRWRGGEGARGEARAPGGRAIFALAMRRRDAVLRLGILGLVVAAPTQPPCQAQAPSSRLTTRWAATVRSDRVLPEYPRPQLVRPAWQNLNWPWDYAIRDSGAAPPRAASRPAGTIRLPFPIASQPSRAERA